jgi:hypothetical protein
MSVEQEINLHNKMVHLIADTAPNDWRKVCIDMEMIVDGSEIAQSCVASCYLGETLEEVDYFLSSELERCFLALNDLMSEREERWKVCKLVVLNTGKLKMNFSYDTPPRLNGDLLAGTQRGQMLSW